LNRIWNWNIFKQTIVTRHGYENVDWFSNSLTVAFFFSFLIAVCNPNGLSTGRFQLGGAGTQTAALGFGGNVPKTNITEEWTGPGAAVTQTITVS
jgi:hypothetical protein